MKKFFGLFILAVSLFVLACSNSSNVENNYAADNSGLGKILIQLPASSKNARNVIVASAESTEYYVITLEGPSPTSVRDTGGSVVAFDELKPGEYTIIVEAYSVENYCISSKSQTAVVRAGETTSVNLTLAKNIFANTNFALWNYDSGSYNFKTFSSTPTSNDLIIPDSSKDFTASNTCVVEDNDGNIYYIGSGDQLFVKGDASPITSLNQLIQAPLYCDEKNNYVYVLSYGGSSLYCFENKAQKSSYIIEGLTVDYKWAMYAICDNDFYYVVYDDPSEPTISTLYHTTLTFTEGTTNIAKASESVKILTTALSTANPPTGLSGISDVRGKFTDITIASDGTAYALICDHSDFSIEAASRNGVALETPIYSRGAIAKITSDGDVTYLGYHDNVRNLTTNVGNYNIDWSDEPYYGSLKLYAPNKTQSSTEFYGPQKIIAKKPDELYIVDCGVNFVLAGYNPDNPAHNADTTGQEESGYHSGNAFIHNRVMKVDLKSFALGKVADHVIVNSYKDGSDVSTNTNDIFGCVNASIKFANLLGYSGHFLCGPATVEDEI